jgi:hypothetical protein
VSTVILEDDTMFYVRYAPRQKKEYLFIVGSLFAVRCDRRLKKQLSVEHIIQQRPAFFKKLRTSFINGQLKASLKLVKKSGRAKW